MFKIKINNAKTYLGDYKKVLERFKKLIPLDEEEESHIQKDLKEG